MTPARLSKIESAIRIVLAFNEAFNRHDGVGMMKLMHDDCIYETSKPARDGMRFIGKDAITQFWQDYFEQTPHSKREIEEIFSLSFRCVMRWKLVWLTDDGNQNHIRGVDTFSSER